MDSTREEKHSESPRSVLLHVVNIFASSSSENEKQNEILSRVERNYAELPDDSKELAEEIALLQEILVKQEQTYNAEVQEYQKLIQNLEIQLQQSEDQKESLDKQADEECKKDEDLKKVMDTYDETVCKLVNEKLKMQEMHNEEIRNLEEELCKSQESLAGVERRFADLHKQYESKKQSKTEVEEELNQLNYSIRMVQISLKKNETAYLELEKHAKDQIEKAQKELNIIKQNNVAEHTRLRGLLKKCDLQIESLEGMIQQKTRENRELAVIYDDYLNKMSGNA